MNLISKCAKIVPLCLMLTAKTFYNHFAITIPNFLETMPKVSRCLIVCIHQSP